MSSGSPSVSDTRRYRSRVIISQGIEGGDRDSRELTGVGPDVNPVVFGSPRLRFSLFLISPDPPVWQQRSHSVRGHHGYPLFHPSRADVSLFVSTEITASQTLRYYLNTLIQPLRTQ